MKRYFAPVLFIGLFCAAWIATKAFAQANNAAAQSHLAAARALAYEPGHDYTGSFEVICVQPQPAGARGNGGRGGGGGRGAAADGGAARGGARGAPPRDQWYAEPAKLFDNLYFVGADNDSAYALTTSDGIILLNTVPDYAAEAEIIEGFKKLGLDPAKMKYVVIADARNPSYGGVALPSGSLSTARVVVRSRLECDGKDECARCYPAEERHGCHRRTETHSRRHDYHRCMSRQAIPPARSP